MRSPYTFFIASLEGGGAQKVVVNLANNLVDLTGHPVHVVLVRKQGVFLKDLRPEVEVFDLRQRRALRSIFPLVRYFKDYKPAVFCASQDYTNVCAIVAWFFSGRPCRMVVREDSVVRKPSGNIARFSRESALELFMRFCYPKACAVVAISRGVAKSLVERNICSDEKIHVIGNPVELLPEGVFYNEIDPSPIPLKGPFICAIGRLEEVKGFGNLLRAFSRLEDKNLQLVILGEGKLRGDLERCSKQLGIDSRVHMPGFVDSPEQVLAKASLFVLSSRWEGFGNVIVEALSLGVPVVSTDCPGGPREILYDGLLGHLVPPDDSEALALAISDALNSPRGTKESRMSRASDFSSEKITEKYLRDVLMPVSRG